jgi:ferredoxin
VSHAVSALVIGGPPPAADVPEKIDLLLVADPSLLAGDGALVETVRDGGAIVLGARGGEPRDAVLALGPNLRRDIRERGIRLKWIDGRIAGEAQADPAAVRTRLLGAFLSADESLARLVRSTDLVGALCAGDALAGCEARTAKLLQSGAESLQSIEPELADDEGPRAEIDFQPRRRLPLMPAPAEETDAGSWPDELHEFHLTGRGGWSAADPLPPLPLVPAGLAPLAELARIGRFYPFVLLADGSEKSLAALIHETVESIVSGGASMDVLREEGGRLARAFGRVAETRGAEAPFAELLDEACDRFVAEFDLSPAARTELEKETERLRQRMPQAAAVIGLDECAVLRLQAAALSRARGPRRFAFREEVRTLLVRLEELLQLDRFHSPEGQSAEALSAAFGESEASRIDTAAMSQLVPEYHGSKRLDPDRRERVTRTVATLRGWLDGTTTEPECVIVHPGLLSVEGSLPTARTVRHPEPLRAAVGLFDGLAQRMTDVIRAARIARLEKDNAYDPEIHDKVLARFDWQALSEDELRLVPPVIAVENGARLRERSLAAFSALLRSGRPVQVLALENGAGVAEEDSWEALSGYHPGLGYLAVAHREAFVLQSTLAHPDRLLDGLTRMADATAPAVALVAVPGWTVPVPHWVQLAASHFGRAFPLFRYDPLAGESWAERFDLSENPEPQQIWTTPPARCVDEAGEEKELGEPFTFAHAAALDPSYRSHFRVLPIEAWDERQVPVARWVAAPSGERLRQVPFLWVVNEDGVLARAILTREMAFACLDHMRAWRILQELGGEGNEYARRAAEAARTEAETRSAEARAALEAEHAAALQEAKTDAAAEVMERLVSVLTSDDAIAALSGGTPLVAPAPAAAAPAAPGPAAAPPPEAAPAEAVEEEEEEEAVSFDEPYIDSILCTTCNECINLNGRMFQYNENRQATVADPAAGTFEELVKAAEKCPARCIHPGVPRSDDSTVTDDLIARAAKFN